MAYKDFGDGQCGRPVAIFSVKNPWPFSFDFEKAAELLDASIDAAISNLVKPNNQVQARPKAVACDDGLGGTALNERKVTK
jgi:hypothetical protein